MQTSKRRILVLLLIRNKEVVCEQFNRSSLGFFVGNAIGCATS